MARIRRSKTNTTYFMDIPREHEIKDKEKLKKKYHKGCLLKEGEDDDSVGEDL